MLYMQIPYKRINHVERVILKCSCQEKNLYFCLFLSFYYLFFLSNFYLFISFILFYFSIFYLFILFFVVFFAFLVLWPAVWELTLLPVLFKDFRSRLDINKCIICFICIMYFVWLLMFCIDVQFPGVGPGVFVNEGVLFHFIVCDSPFVFLRYLGRVVSFSGSLQIHYSRPSVARTLMDSLPSLFRTRSRIPNKKNPIAVDIIVFWIISDNFFLY